jgi:hypothetical protein
LVSVAVEKNPGFAVEEFRYWKNCGIQYTGLEGSQISQFRSVQVSVKSMAWVRSPVCLLDPCLSTTLRTALGPKQYISRYTTGLGLILRKVTGDY